MCFVAEKKLQTLYLFMVFISISAKQYQQNIRPHLMEGDGKVSKLLIPHLCQSWGSVENCCLLKG